jgi:hypothetical protein
MPPLLVSVLQLGHDKFAILILYFNDESTSFQSRLNDKLMNTLFRS